MIETIATAVGASVLNAIVIYVNNKIKNKQKKELMIKFNEIINLKNKVNDIIIRKKSPSNEPINNTLSECSTASSDILDELDNLNKYVEKIKKNKKHGTHIIQIFENALKDMSNDIKK